MYAEIKISNSQKKEMLSNLFIYLLRIWKLQLPKLYYQKGYY